VELKKIKKKHIWDDIHFKTGTKPPFRRSPKSCSVRKRANLVYQRVKRKKKNKTKQKTKKGTAREGRFGEMSGPSYYGSD